MAAGSLASLDRLSLLGLSQSRVPAELRDIFYQLEPQLPRLLEELKILSLDDFSHEEAMAIATCERVEILTVSNAEAPREPALLEMLSRVSGLPADRLTAHSYLHKGPEALAHLFKVAAALDSEVLGEPHVLGQLRQCHRAAAERKMTGPLLESLLPAVYGAARQVREETPLSEQPTSIAAAAVQTAASLHGDLTDSRALLLGGGEMSELLLDELRQAGLTDLVVMHGSAGRAAAAAKRLRCHYRPWEELEAAMTDADIVVSDLSSGRCSITRPLVQAALRSRRQKPIFLIDAAVPGDIEPAVEALDDAFVYSLDDLERVALAGHTSREAAVAMAQKILVEAQEGLLRRGAERAAVPAIAGLRAHCEALRQEVLAAGNVDAATATHRLVQRLLHDPSEVLRATAAEGMAGEKLSMTEAALRLFRLPAVEAAPEEGGDQDDNSENGDRA